MIDPPLGTLEVLLAAHSSTPHRSGMFRDLIDPPLQSLERIPIISVISPRSCEDVHDSHLTGLGVESLEPLENLLEELEAEAFLSGEELKTLREQETRRIEEEQTEHHGGRAPAEVPDDELHNDDQAWVSLIYAGCRTRVSWDRNAGEEEVQNMLFSAADSMLDGGVLLREVTDVTDLTETLHKLLQDNLDRPGGRLKEYEIEGEIRMLLLGQVLAFEDFGLAKNASSYLIIPGPERSEAAQLLGDRWRRLQLEIEPLRHPEVAAAVMRMRNGANLLLHQWNKLNIRMFQLSSDLRRLIWYADAGRSRTAIDFRDVVSATPLLSKGDGENATLSMEIKYQTKGPIPGSTVIKSLCITLRSEGEFDYWLLGVKALMCHRRGLKVSKGVLLAHSRRYREGLKTVGPSVQPFRLAEVDRVRVLEKHIGSLPIFGKEQLRSKWIVLRRQIDYSLEEASVRGLFVNQSQRVRIDLREDELAAVEDLNSEIEMLKVLLIQGVAKLEKTSQMIEVELEEAQQESLRHIGQQLAVSAEEREVSPSRLYISSVDLQREIGEILWHLEVDVENISDILRRVVRGPGRRHSLRKMFAKLGDTFLGVGGTPPSPPTMIQRQEVHAAPLVSEEGDEALPQTPLRTITEETLLDEDDTPPVYAPVIGLSLEEDDDLGSDGLLL